VSYCCTITLYFFASNEEFLGGRLRLRASFALYKLRPKNKMAQPQRLRHRSEQATRSGGCPWDRVTPECISLQLFRVGILCKIAQQS
jgi:hypothetical protein